MQVHGIPFAFEFVMQIYESDKNNDDNGDEFSNAAQWEIWHRTVDVVFKHIFRSLSSKASADARRENAISSTLSPHMGF